MQCPVYYHHQSIFITEPEIWKPIKGWKGFYEVSNMGRVRSLDRAMIHNINGKLFIKKGRILKQTMNQDGYMKVTLTKSSKTDWPYVHRLVALAHVPNPYSLPEVDHLYKVKTDNRASQLAWVTESENCLRRSRYNRAA